MITPLAQRSFSLSPGHSMAGRVSLLKTEQARRTKTTPLRCTGSARSSAKQEAFFLVPANDGIIMLARYLPGTSFRFLRHGLHGLLPSAHLMDIGHDGCRWPGFEKSFSPDPIHHWSKRAPSGSRFPACCVNEAECSALYGVKHALLVFLRFHSS